MAIKMFPAKYQSLADVYAASRWDGGCFIWQHARDSGGYGSLRSRGRTWRAHEIAWFLAGNERPEGHVLHHVCGNPSCVRVDHLELTTPQEHWIITKTEDPDFEKKRVAALTQATCERGHDNWYVNPKTGRRQCRTCQNAWKRWRRASS